MKRALLPALLVVVAAFVLVIPTPFTGVLPLIRPPATALPGGAERGGPARMMPVRTTVRHLLLITIDTLRADRIGAYGHAAARTPVIDGLARSGVRFDQAFAPAPITLTSHASLLTGRYPVGHGARHNGLRMRGDVPMLAAMAKEAGFATGAFVSAFPLDRRFGLSRGFDLYDDRMPRLASGRAANERPGADTVAAALAWVRSIQAPKPRRPATDNQRLFLWVHLFEPHAPYEGDPRRAPIARYDDEIARADALLGRLIDGLGPLAAEALVIVAGDHGEAFGEHGENGHSIFVYDTTLRVPLVMHGTGAPAGLVVADPVSLVDVASTAARALGLRDALDTDGVDLGPKLRGGTVPARPLFAESFAPLLDFGWAPLRATRVEGWKYIAAPRAELYHVATDSGEAANVLAAEPVRAAALAARTDRYGPADLPRRSDHAVGAEVASRLRALGYASGGSTPSGAARPDPKDRIPVASALARVTAGEASGAEAERLLTEALRVDPSNPLAHVRLGFLLEERGRCDLAVPHLERAIEVGYPSADPAIGLAACRQAVGNGAGALNALVGSRAVEPDNPVVEANIGILLMAAGRDREAADTLARAVRLDPDFLEARFNLARALARAGRPREALAEANELLRRLPPMAPQRPEVERLVAALR